MTSGDDLGGHWPLCMHGRWRGYDVISRRSEAERQQLRDRLEPLVATRVVATRELQLTAWLLSGSGSGSRSGPGSGSGPSSGSQGVRVELKHSTRRAQREAVSALAARGTLRGGSKAHQPGWKVLRLCTLVLKTCSGHVVPLDRAHSQDDVARPPVLPDRGAHRTLDDHPSPDDIIVVSEGEARIHPAAGAHLGASAPRGRRHRSFSGSGATGVAGKGDRRGGGSRKQRTR